MTYVSYFFREDGPAYASLLKWVNSKIPDHRVKNFNSDWRSGVALCALNNSVSPGSCRDYQLLDPKDKVNNCQKGSFISLKLSVHFSKKLKITLIYFFTGKMQKKSILKKWQNKKNVLLVYRAKKDVSGRRNGFKMP